MKGRPLSEYLDDILEAIADIETFTSAINEGRRQKVNLMVKKGI